MSNVGFVNIIKVALFKVTSDISLYVGSSLSMLVMAVYQSDGLGIEVVLQALGPRFDTPVLTSPSG